MRAREFIDYILGLPPAGVSDHLDQTPSLAVHEGQEMLWKGIADALTTRSLTLAQAEAVRPLALEWAATAIKVYKRLANESRSDEMRESHVSSEMAVRCGLINLLSPLADHPILDPAPLEEWFLSSVGSVEASGVGSLRRARVNGSLIMLQPLIAKGVFRRNGELLACQRAFLGS